MLFAYCAVIFVMPVLMNAVSIIWIIAEDVQKSAAHAQKNVQVWQQPKRYTIKRKDPCEVFFVAKGRFELPTFGL